VIALLGTGLLTVALGLLAFDIAGRGRVRAGTRADDQDGRLRRRRPADRRDRRPAAEEGVLITADLIRFAIALLLPFVTEAWQIYVLVFVLQSASATFTPAFQSLIPVVLPTRTNTRGRCRCPGSPTTSRRC
jgi:hypothetical protein